MGDSTGENVHSVPDQGRAGALIRYTIDRNETVVANTHAAEQPAASTFIGVPEHAYAVLDECSGDRYACAHVVLCLVYSNVKVHLIIHVLLFKLWTR
jgi:hypothetical protein